MNYLHVLGATDFSTIGDLALGRAAALAVAANAKLTALTVLAEPEPPSPLIPHYDINTDEGRIARAKLAAIEALKERVPASARESGIEIAYEVRVGDPAGEILVCDVQLRPDLIVLATHGRRGWHHWIMGSVSERVVQMAHADVLSVREHDEDLDAT